MFLLNGKPLSPDSAFRHPVTGTQYPANWLRCTTMAEKQAIGIEEVPDPVQYDQRYYWDHGTPKPLEQVQAMRVREIKAQATAIIAQTDWQMLRAIERFIHGELDAEGQELSAKREEIRQASDVAEATVAAAKDVEALRAVKVELMMPKDVEKIES